MDKKTKYSPAIVFGYNRANHLNKTITALSKNIGAENTDLYIFSDGPKNNNDDSLILELRKALRKIKGFKTVSIIERPINLGLSKSIIMGVSEVMLSHDRVIVLEDDMITSPYFLEYMNQALIQYECDPRVACIHGYVYPGLKHQPEAFFLRGADCWGWGTWRDSWRLFNPDGKYLLNEIVNKNLVNQFDFNGSYPYSTMLENQTSGKNDSWAIRWYASIFLEGKLTLYPSRSLVKNIGLDSSGQNCVKSNIYDVNLTYQMPCISDIEVKHSDERYREFENFFRQQNHGFFQRFKNRLKIFSERIN